MGWVRECADSSRHWHGKRELAVPTIECRRDQRPALAQRLAEEHVLASMGPLFIGAEDDAINQGYLVPLRRFNGAALYRSGRLPSNPSSVAAESARSARR